MATTNRYQATGLGAEIVRQGRTIEWVAKQGGVHPSLITHLLRGRRTIGEEPARDIASAMGVRFSLLFELSDRSVSMPVEPEAIPA